jgi:putative CocE/NonD family hydrolase
LRDGVELSANVYTPKDQTRPLPCVFTLTPYIAQSYHDRGMYFAAHGVPFLTVDARGRGNSGGEFTPNLQEAKDGYDVVEWLARQPYCNGKVSMWGGSYAGYNQWATAKEAPPHLATIVPVAAPYMGVDFPFRRNILDPYVLQWLLFTSGHASQAQIFGDQDFWKGLYRERFEKGEPFVTLPHALGGHQAQLQEWIQHPQADAYYDRYAPTIEQFKAFTLPILTITGSYDDDQPGALTYYKNYMALASPEQRARHYLIIGPWDHSGTRTPQPTFMGVRIGPAGLLDLPQLHLDWYAWTMSGGPKPPFLKKPVAYYVMGAEAWRYADSLEAITAEQRAYFLSSTNNPTDVMRSGSLTSSVGGGGADHYQYDPRDVSTGLLESQIDLTDATSQTLVYSHSGKQLVYHTSAFERDTEISGFFKLEAWIAIDQPDTDFGVSVYEIDRTGRSVLLSTDRMRARYREQPSSAKLITTTQPLKYEFDQFTFVSRRIAAGGRLRLILGPINSILAEKNYNTGGVVAAESIKDSRVVTVKLFHDKAHPSALLVPIGQPGR